jgi:cysteine desulfurase
MRLASGSEFANPSSLHQAGRRARAALEDCRERIARRLSARAPEITFTSGGTEANRLAIAGALAAFRSRPGGLAGAHAVVSAIEHPSTRDVYRQLAEEDGLAVTWVGAGPDGRVDAGALERAIGPETVIVSLIHASNETGVIQDLEAAARACRGRGIPLHTDAVQSLGKIPLDLPALGADLVSLSAHKIGGPKGAGALWVRAGARFRGPHRGGPQERGLRPGTENLPAAAGFARAVEVFEPRGPGLRDRLLDALLDIPEAALNGERRWLLPNTINISFPGVPSELLLIGLDLEGVAASAGSACASGAREPSHVLRAMGLAGERLESAVRFSLGWTTTAEELDRAAGLIRAVAMRIRASWPAPRGPGASPRTGAGTAAIAPGSPRAGP